MSPEPKTEPYIDHVSPGFNAGSGLKLRGGRVKIHRQGFFRASTLGADWNNHLILTIDSNRLFFRASTLGADWNNHLILTIDSNRLFLRASTLGAD
jgi:hypothetical protein